MQLSQTLVVKYDDHNIINFLVHTYKLLFQFAYTLLYSYIVCQIFFLKKVYLLIFIQNLIYLYILL